MKKQIFLLLFLFQYSTLKSQNIESISNLVASERFDEAIDSLLVLKKKEQGNKIVYFMLGETLIKSYISDPYSDTKKGIINKATEYFDEGIKADINNPLNYVGKGIIPLFQNGDTIKADEYFNKALNLVPKKKRKIKDLDITTLIKLATAELYNSHPRFYKSDSYVSYLVELRPKMPQVYIAAGNINLARSDASKAIINYKKALYLKKTALTNVLIARIYMMARNLNESRSYFEDALKIDSTFAPAYKGLGELYYLAGEARFAKENYSKFLRLTGNNIPAKIGYVKSLFKAKDYAEAFKESEEVLKVDSSKKYLYRLASYTAFEKDTQDLDKSLFYITKFFKKSSEEELIPSDYSYYGRILLKLKGDSADIQQGISMLEKAYLADTASSNALQELILGAYYNKDYNTAIKYQQIKIAKGDTSDDNYMFLGKLHYYNKDYDEAAKTFNIVLSKDTTDINTNLWMTYALSSKPGDLKEGFAKPYFERILRITEGNIEKYSKEIFNALSYLGSYYAFSNYPNYNKAIDYFNRILNLDKTNEDWMLKGYYSLAYIYNKQKDWRRAKPYYEQIIKLRPGDKEAQGTLKAINYRIVMEDLEK